MEDREDLKSILPYLPLGLRSSSLFWPSPVVEALKAISRGPNHSQVDTGEALFLAISDIRSSLSLCLPTERLPYPTGDGYALFFDDLLPRVEASKWFRDVLPRMANLLLQLPSLLESHYQSADGYIKTGLRLLESQESGMVLLSQELIGALLACSFLCLFPITNRCAKHLPTINFDHLFASLYDSYSEAQENKILCIAHYFERISYSIPCGVVSFERKVLPLEHIHSGVSYPRAELWSKSCIPLCRFEIYESGLIEDQSSEALEVDFANKYLGGGALNRGCVQEEIRFMICPELIIGMLFLPSLADNEAIEIVGAERFSNYTGYASSFRFSGDYVDTRFSDTKGRRRTRIVAIDALCWPGKRQFGLDCLLREVNKAFCGFLDQSGSRQYQKMYQDDESSCSQISGDFKCPEGCSVDSHLLCEAPTSSNTNGRRLGDQLVYSCKGSRHIDYVDNQNQIGIATGNWGCGAFGGDPELKATIQWIAASQALRNLDQVTKWILSQGWTAGELWNLLVEYSSQRLKGETEVSFFSWLLPDSKPSDPVMFDDPPQIH